MSELRELERRLASIRALREIVNAMRNLAAVYVRRAENALRATRPYTDVVETALQVLLDRHPQETVPDDGDGPVLIVVFASDQGLCATYNERVIRAAVALRDELGSGASFIVVGARGHQELRLAGEDPLLTVRSPTSLEGIRAQVTTLAAKVFHTFMAQAGRRLFFVYNRFVSLGQFQSEQRRVLPPTRAQLSPQTPPPFRAEPLLTAAVPVLLEPMLEEYFFIEFHRALLESHASENGARLQAMTAAGNNIDRNVQELSKTAQAARQDMITSELLDVIGGVEALRQ